MNICRRLSLHAVLLLVTVAISASSPSLAAMGQPPQTLAADISPEALAQIDALVREKASRSGRAQKIDSQLVYEMKMAQGEPIAPGVAELATDLPYTSDYRLVLDVMADVSDAVLEQLRAEGAEILHVDAAAGTVRLLAEVNEIEWIAALPGVHFVQPKQEATTHSAAGQGSKASEGELTHRAFAARGTFHADGSGVKIGVLSDGVTSLAASQTLGDLGAVTVLPGQAGSGDEGTAMLEIIHDLAPGAQLYFATAFNGITSFADNIRALRAAGCDIIVDDVFYYVESPFQDGQAASVVSNTNGGAVIQAVKDVIASGAMYFSSAGNSGNKNDGTSGTWEGDFADGGAPAAPFATGNRLHMFGAQAYDVVTSPGNLINLSWSDPLGGSANDYDLFRLNSAGTAVLSSSTNLQSGTQDPYEQISGGSTGDRIVIVKSAAAAARFLHLGTNRGRLSISTSGEIHGHAATSGTGAFGVAATSAPAAYPGAFTSANVVETFSSDGPRRIFFNGNGTAITPGNVSSVGGQVLAKPDITAADGVSVTGSGGFWNPFYGTSAAAPHAAAIAGLIKSANASLTQAQIRAALVASAIDIETPGVDRDSGAGIIMADGALRTIASGALLARGTIVASENPGNGNGAINAGEGARITIPLTNAGVTAATGIVGTLTTTTPGVILTQPAQAVYPDLAVGASASNASPFLFTMAANAACPLTIDFTLTLSYTGGPNAASIAFQVQTGSPPFTITTTLDSTAPASAPGITPATGVQIGRLWRDGMSGSCAAPKSVPAIFDASGSRRFDTYSIATCTESAASCATVSLSGGSASSMFTAAYTPSFDASTLQQNYAADPGTSGAVSYELSVPGGGHTVAVAVHELNPGGAAGQSYTLTVSGLCTGPCATPNQLPVARARNVTVGAGPAGTANASIDDGSSDADGDPLVITQTPAGPYPVGTTAVLLTVVDPKGAASQAAGNVTVTSLPTIATQPQSQTIASGLPATLNVAVAGTAPFGFQWYVGTSGTTAAPIAGATSSSFTTPGLAYTERYWVRASNAYGTADSATAVVTRPLTIAPSSPWPSAAAGTPYSLTLSATGGTSPYTWSAGLDQWGQTTLPSGLTLNSTTGEVSGAPDAAGTFAVVVRVTGADADFTQQTFSLPVNGVPDPLLDEQWHLKDRALEIASANVRPAWPITRGAGVVIGIVDDGLQGTHPDLRANVVASLSHDFGDHDADPGPVTSGTCATGAECRGTAAAGIAAARSDNSIGVSGVAPLASLAGIRLAPDPSDADQAAAFTHQLGSVAIENHSWRRADDGQTLAAPGALAENALATAAATGRGGAGRIFVWAAGDGRANGDNCNFDGYATNRFGIAVGAVDDAGQQAPYSESCSALLVSAPSSGAPGVTRRITTTDLAGFDGDDAGDYTNGFGGTEAAAPVVSGVAALMLARNAALTWRDVQHILVRSSRQVNPSDASWTTGTFPHSEKYGFGLVDALAAVNLAATWTNVRPEAAVPAVAHALNVAVPDNNPSGVSNTIAVDAQYAAFTVEHVEVEFAATHPHRGDLEVTLTSPSGIVSHLGTVRPGDAGANFAAWRFRSVRHWGEAASGTWTLKVADRAAGNNGVWTGWTLRIYGTAPAPVPAPGGGGSVGGGGGGDAGGGGGGGGPAPSTEPTAPSTAPSVPGAPSGLVSSVSSSMVVLSWSAPASGSTPTTYVLEAGSAPGRSDLIVYRTGTPATSYTASGVGAGTYFVRVRAANAVGTSPASNEIAFSVGTGGAPSPAGPSGSPGAPSGFVAIASGSNLTLTWNPPAGGGPAAFYVVQAGSSSGLNDLASFSTGSPAPSFSAGGVPAGTYFLRVSAGNGSGIGLPSNEAVVTIGGGGVGPCAGQPGAPGGLRSTVSGSTVTLEWTGASGGPASYLVEAGSSPGQSDLAANDTGTPATSLTATGVGAGTYFVRMRARNSCGTSGPSNEVTVVVR